MGKGTCHMKNCHSLLLLTSTAEIFSSNERYHIFSPE